MTRIALPRALFGPRETVFLDTDGVQASLLRYESGVEAVRLANRCGAIVVLPFMGQMIWDASFEGVRLTMGSLFDQPLPAANIIDTYGCFAFHSGLLRNGCPTREDDHALHGEFPVAAMDHAGLELGGDHEGAFVRLTGERTYRQGFGAHYRARPSVTIRADRTVFDIGMNVQNLSGAPMDLMYMCHINYAFAEDARVIQPAPFTPEHVAARTAIPLHVPATAEYRALIDALAQDPERMEILDPALSYDPEQVFALHGLRRDADGNTHVLLRRAEGDGFVVSYDPSLLPHCTRWLLRNADQQVAAFALPATCGPEGYLAEHAKGNVVRLAPHASAAYWVRTGYLDDAAAEQMATSIGQL